MVMVGHRGRVCGSHGGDLWGRGRMVLREGGVRWIETQRHGRNEPQSRHTGQINILRSIMIFDN